MNGVEFEWLGVQGMKMVDCAEKDEVQLADVV